MSNSQDDETRVAYALIDQSWGWPPQQDESSPYAIHPPSTTDASTGNNGVSAVNLTTMEQWYEYYAARTPSSGYLGRLEELEAENVRQQQAEKESKSGGGWFGKLFGRGNTTNSDVDKNEEVDETESESDDDNMVTQLHLDVNAINHEARSFHRFHLASEQRALVLSNDLGEHDGHSVVLPVRISVGWDDIESASDAKIQTHLCIVGYGQIAEFPSLPETSFATTEQQVEMDNNMQTNHNVNAAKISLTSDHKELLSFVTGLDKDDPSPLYDLRHCRAASIGSDCLIISWGLGGDGSIVIYRRIETSKQSPRNKRVGFVNEPAVDWVAVAFVTPSDSVIEAALHDMTPDPCLDERYKHRQQDHNLDRLFELGSLRVTDLVPMVFNNESSSCALAISRLGGFMELLPLPSWVWLEKMNSPPRKLVDLSVTRVAAFSTSIHHTDILSIDAYRTRVGMNIEWDGMHTPDGPPAEFVLVASGRPVMPSQGDQELGRSVSRGAALSFWGITAVQSNDPRDSGFGLNVTCIQRCDLNNLGADSTAFITGSTVEHWSEITQGGSNETGRGKKQKYTPSATCNVMASVPVTSLRFTPSPLLASNINSGVLLAVLDYNGGVTVMDCSRCIQSVEQVGMSVENGPDSSVSHTQIIPLTGRDISMQSSDKSLGISRASQIEWWRTPSVFTANRERQQEEHSLIDPSLLGTFFLATNTSVTQMQKKASSVANKIRLQRWRLTSNEYSDSAEPTELCCISAAHQSPATMLLPMTCRASSETLPFLRKSSSQLSVCGVRKFTDPTEIITVLLHQSDPGRALDVARSFGGAQHFGSAIMNKCQIQLWEEQRNIEALKLVSDHEYVVREALSLDQKLSKENGVHMKHLVDIYREALLRLDELRSGGGASLSPEWISSSAAQLGRSLRFVGTFELLVQHFADNGMLHETYHTDSLARRFLVGFQRCDLFNLASSAASRGDISALTIILVRHPVTTHIRMKLLELIPFHIDITSYEHLLPCIVENSPRGGLFLPKSQIGLPKQFLDSLEMLLFLSGGNLPTLSVVVNEKDEDFIIKHHRDAQEDFGIQSTNAQASKEEVASWYLQICLSMHNSTKDVNLVKRICELALVRLGFVSFAEDGTYQVSSLGDLFGCGEKSSVDKLAYIYHASHLLDGLVDDKIKESILVSPSAEVKLWSAETELFRSITQFCAMIDSDAVSFILESASSSNNPVLLERRIAQVFFGGDGLTPSPGGVLIHDTGSGGLSYDAIVELCLEKLRQSRTRKRKMPSAGTNDSTDLEIRLQQALSVCAVFASLFGNKKWSEDELVSFARAIFQCTMDVVGDEWSLLLCGAVDSLWSIFETLPYSLLSNPHQKEAVKHLQLRLVMIQLCSKWGQRHSISHSVKSFVCSETDFFGNCASEEESRVLTAACSDVMSVMARGFCEHSVGQNGHGRDLLLDFICDVDEVDKLYLSSHAEHTGSVGAIVLPLLLKRDMLKLLSDLLRLRPGWFCNDQTRAAILSHIQVPANGKDRASLSRRCLETLGPLFPELAIEAEHQERVRDAKRYAASEMRIDDQLLEHLFSEQHSRSPVSLIKSLLASYPESLLIGCEFWSDEMGSKRACADAASYFSAQISATLKQTSFDESKQVLPPMPGSLVMQLSNIHGRSDSFGMLQIKQYMIKGVLELGLAPAAIAICFSMLCDAAFARQQQDDMDDGTNWTARHEYLVQHCVIVSITRHPFNNAQIKKDLCTQSLTLLRTHRSPLCPVLLEIFSALEYEELVVEKLHLESHSGTDSVPAQQQSEFLVFKAAELVAKQAKDFVEHSKTKDAAEVGNPFCNLSRIFGEISRDAAIDVSGLMSSLRTSAEESNNQVLNDLSQAFLNWAVENAFKLSNGMALSAFNIRIIVELGASCLAELKDKKTAALVLEMALDEFEANATTSKSLDSLEIQPDPALAQRLHERGYGWNAARRACVMVNNKSYSEALGWAVAHFMDDDFDSPLIITNKGNEGSLRQDLISLVGSLLQSIKARHESKPALSVTHTKAKISPVDNPVQDERKTLLVSNRCTVPPPSLNETKASMVPKISATPAPPPLKPPVPTMPLQGASDSNEKELLMKKVPTAAKTRQPASRLRTGNDIMSPSQVNPFLETPTNAAATGNSSTIPNSADSMSMSSIDGSLGSRASINKQVKQGKALTKTLTAEDRKRLASEGRRLLEAARRKNKSVVAPPTSITTKPIARP